MVVLRRQLCDSCCLTVGGAAALLLSLILPLLAPWHILLPPLEPESERVKLPHMPTNFSISVVHAGCDGTLPLATIAAFVEQNVPVLLRPHCADNARDNVQTSAPQPFAESRTAGFNSDAAVVALLNRTIQTRVRPSRARAAGSPLTALVFGGVPRKPNSDGEFYPSLQTSWREFLRDTQNHEAAALNGEDQGVTGCACYAARLSIPNDLPEMDTLLRLPSASEHPLASTVGEPYPDGPVLYASHGRAESTPIHFDAEENCALLDPTSTQLTRSSQPALQRTLEMQFNKFEVPGTARNLAGSLDSCLYAPWLLLTLLTTRHAGLYVIAGNKQVVLYEPHESSRGRLPRHDIYRTTSTVPPHTPAERDQVEQSFPSLRGSRPLYLTVSAGDALYLPAFWWHGLIAVASQPDSGTPDTVMRSATFAAAAGKNTNGGCGSVLHSLGYCNQLDAEEPQSSSPTARVHSKATAVSAPVMSISYWAQPRAGKFKADTKGQRQH